MAHIALQEISASYGSHEVIHHISFDIADGNLHTLLGPSGCGKSTTLRLIAGFLSPDSGTILLNGRDITHLPPEKRAMGIVFQNYALFPNMSVAQNVAYGLKVDRRPKAEITKIVDQYLEITGLGDFANRNVMELSGGQQQRVAIARALAPAPQVLLLDEPMANLDAELRERMRDEIRRIQHQVGVTTLFITHDQQEALALSDTISVMHEGTIVQTGSPHDIYEDPINDYVAHFMGKINTFTTPEGTPLYARPETLTLTAEPTNNTLTRAQITSKRYLGFATEYLLVDSAHHNASASMHIDLPSSADYLVLELNNATNTLFSVDDVVYINHLVAPTDTCVQ